MNKQLKICVYAIAKNEAQFVQRFAESAKDADLILVADTGSTDETLAACKDAGVVAQTICITPWRFDHARNAALALVPSDMDVCVSLDLDEVLEPGWREEIERLWVPGTTRLRYLYDWGCGIAFKTEKIHARHGYFWHHPCHEYLRLDGRCKELVADTDTLLVTHLADPNKSRGQYLDLLALSTKEDPTCPRNSFYYARELTFYCRWDDAIKELTRYLTLPGATWDIERSYAMRMLGRSYSAKGDFRHAESWWLRAAGEATFEREPWYELANFYYHRQRWSDCYLSALRALSVTQKPLHHNVNPDAWSAAPYDLAAIAAWNLGQPDDAIRYGKEALALSPNDERLKANLEWYERSKK